MFTELLNTWITKMKVISVRMSKLLISFHIHHELTYRVCHLIWGTEIYLVHKMLFSDKTLVP